MGNSLAGVAELAAKLEQLGVKARKSDLRAAARAGIKVAQDRSVSTIPMGRRAHRTYKGRIVAPGFSARSIRAVIVLSPEGFDAQAHLGVRKEAFYAVQFTERGTVKERARPWLKPAFDETLDRQTQALAEKLKEKIEEVARS